MLILFPQRPLTYNFLKVRVSIEFTPHSIWRCHEAQLITPLFLRRLILSPNITFMHHDCSLQERPSAPSRLTRQTCDPYLTVPHRTVPTRFRLMWLSQVSIDVRAPSAGTLVEQMAADGDTVEVGAPLMKLDTSGGGGGGETAAAAPGENCFIM